MLTIMNDTACQEYMNNCSTNAYGGTRHFWSLWLNIKKQSFEIKKTKLYNTHATKNKGTLIFLDQYYSDDLQRNSGLEGYDDPIVIKIEKRINTYYKKGMIF